MSALQTILAEMTIKDLASPNLKKIQAAVEKDIKSMKEGEKQATKFQKAMAAIKGAGGSAMGAAGGAIGNLNQKAQGLASAVGSGSGFHQAVSQIHFVGPYLAAALSAMHAASANFTAGVRTLQVQQVASSNYVLALKKTTIAGTKLATDTFFHIRDKQQALTALADSGVKAGTIDKHSDKIAAFTKAQGHTTLEGGMQALMSGQVKSGRGLSEIQIKMIQQYSTLMKDGMSADMGMRGIARILEKAEKPMGQTAKSFEDLNGATKTASSILSEEEATSVHGMSGGYGTFSAAQKAKRLEMSLTNTLGEGAGYAVNKIDETFRDDKKEIKKIKGGAINLAKKKRAGGGEVSSAESYLVGENGPEMFKPNSSGRIIPKGGGGGGGMSVTNIFNVNGGNIAQIEGAVMDAINKAAQTLWRQNTGLAGLG